MAKAKDRVADVKPYVQRAIQDEELRDNLRSAFDTARDVYDELIGKLKRGAVDHLHIALLGLAEIAHAHERLREV